MKNLSRLFVSAVALSMLSSCALIEKFSYKPREITYLEKSSKFDMKTFFNGDIDVFAINQDNNGKITGTYTARMNGRWDENKGVLQQNFVYENGKKDSRTWLITTDSDGSFSAVGHDVEAPVKGKQIGNAMQMIYTLVMKSEGNKTAIYHEDNIYLVDDRSAIGVAFVRKNGVSDGKSIISYKRIGKDKDVKEKDTKDKDVKEKDKDNKDKD